MMAYIRMNIYFLNISAILADKGFDSLSQGLGPNPTFATYLWPNKK